MKTGRRAFVGSSLLAATGAFLPVRRLWANAGGSVAIPGEVATRTASGKSITLTASVIKDFDASLRGDLLLTSHPGYESARRLWNPAFDYHPALIVRCAGAADVMQAVQFARSSDLVTAVRGGGHSISGQSGCDGGMVIDLSGMRGIRIDPVHRRVEAQPGVRLGELDQETQAHGLVTTLGTAPDTGIAGLTLGGGFGRLDRRFGLACDNLRSVDIVTAAGKLLHASEQENADLFWGVRGGGGNFGIVTSFDYQLHPLGPQVLAGFRAFPFNQARSVLTALEEFAQRMPEEMYVRVQVGRNPKLPPPGTYVGYEVVYSGALSEGERLLAPLEKLGEPLSDSVAAKTYVAAQGATEKGSAEVNERNVYWKSGFLNSLSGDLIDEIVRRFESAPPFVDVVMVFREGGAFGRVKPDATAFWNRWPAWVLLMQASWNDLSNADEKVKAARAFWGGLEPFTRNYYINADTSRDEQRLRATYGDNYPRLVKLKNKFDPTNLFRLNANIKPTVRA
jgi:FAD/FMN-containing dehydrogenase